jgi:hypothetical protein
MKRVCAATAALLMLGGFSLAQGSVSGTTSGTTAPGSSGSSSQGTTGLGTGSSDATVPPGTTLPGGSQAPPTSSTIGRGSGGNPYNPQDLIGRSNPQDLTNPRARNPSDTSNGITGAPQIMVPER